MDVFLGSSKTLDDLRLAFTALCDSLADAVSDTCGATLQARVWETEGYEIERNRSKQQAYDEVIRACERAFFLVDGTLGTYTFHEYLVAAEACAQRGLPLVDVWVRHLDRPSMHDENTRLMLAHAAHAPYVALHDLDGEDALMLDMLGLFVQDFPALALEVKRGAVWTGHKLLVHLTDVTAGRQDAFEALLAARHECASDGDVPAASATTDDITSDAHAHVEGGRA